MPYPLPTHSDSAHEICCAQQHQVAERELGTKVEVAQLTNYL
jgi:hypothetical protein